MNRAVSLLTAAVALSACVGSPETLMLTPDLYAESDTVLFEDIPPPLQTTHVDLFYVTDRLPERTPDGALGYGTGRSHSLAFGSVVVGIGDDLTWDELVRESRVRKRREPLHLRTVSVTELGRFPKTPLQYVVVGRAVKRDRELLSERARVKVKARRELRRRLDLALRKEVVIYVHGYRNSFDKSAFALAELWHFLGREQVPILYAWPAGRKGLFGYVYDRESGEFTIYHLKQFLRTLATLAEIEKIHIIAHSRGTDVVVSALRELFIEARAAGQDPRLWFRIDNLVLAAPDMDYHVARQRVHAERLGLGIGQINVYTSEDDTAINIAENIFGSSARLGDADAEEYSDDRKELLSALPNLHIIDVDYVRGRGLYGHRYFRKSPAASSDLILALRYGRRPGIEDGRPLIPEGFNFWLLQDDYLLRKNVPSNPRRAPGER